MSKIGQWWSGDIDLTDELQEVGAAGVANVKKAVTIDVLESVLNWALLGALVGSTFFKSKGSHVWLWGAAGAFIGYQKATAPSSLGALPNMGAAVSPHLSPWLDARIKAGQPRYGAPPVQRPAPMTIDMEPFEGEV